MGQKVAPIEGSTQSKGNIQFADRNDEGDNPGCLKIFHTRTRFLLMALVLLSLASIWSNILSFNFALICFIKPPVDDSNSNSTLPTSPDRSATQFNPNEKSILTAAVAGSALLANFAIVQLVNRFGIRTIFTFAGFLSALGTILLPTAIYSGFYFTLACRIMQGN